MGGIMDFIARPFGALMQFVYYNLAFENYGVAIIFFTIFVRIIMLPLSVKQQKSMEKQQELMPELEALKKNYQNDTQRYNEEQQKLYAKHNINPLSGCLPLLIQLPLITTLYTIIRNPLTYVAGLSSTVIKALTKLDFIVEALGSKNVGEIQLADYFLSHTDKIAEAGSSIGQALSESDFISMTFLKIFNLGATPSISPSTIIDDPKLYLPLLLIPILTLATTIIQQKLTTVLTAKPEVKTDNNGNKAPNSMNTMLKFMPILTLVFSFMVPAGLGFYWIIGNILGIGQTVLIKKVFSKKKEGSVLNV